MATGDVLAIVRQVRKGAWTNSPDDPNYLNHWQTTRPPTEAVRAVYPGVARGQIGLIKPKQTVNVVLTDQNLYVDTPNVERVGPVARFAGQVLDRGGMSEPRQVPLAQATMQDALLPNRLLIQAPSLPTITARTDAYVGRPTDLSAGGQMKNLWNTLRG